MDISIRENRCAAREFVPSLEIGELAASLFDNNGRSGEIPWTQQENDCNLIAAGGYLEREMIRRRLRVCCARQRLGDTAGLLIGQPLGRRHVTPSPAEIPY